MNGLLNKRRIKYILLISLIISSTASVLVSLEDTLLPHLSFDIVYLIYLPSIMLLVIALHSQYKKRDVIGISAVAILFLLILLNTIFGGVI